MHFVLLMHTYPADWEAAPQADRGEVLRKHAALREELTASGELVNGAGVVGPGAAKTVRWNEGDPRTEDGPVAEVDPPMTAYYVLDCATEERAMGIAEHLLDFHVVAVEVRAVHDSVGFDRPSPPG